MSVHGVIFRSTWFILFCIHFNDDEIIKDKLQSSENEDICLFYHLYNLANK